MHKNKSDIAQPSEVIILKCKSGDSGSFKTLVGMYQQFAFNLAFRILLNEEHAKDAVQNSFIKVWRNIKKYKSDYLFTTWFYKIIANTCYDMLKSEKIRSNIDSGCLELPIDTRTEEAISNKDLARHIKQLSKGLSPKQRMVFILIDLQDLSISEVSDILRMPKGVVKSNIYYARKNIKEKLNQLEPRRTENELYNS